MDIPALPADNTPRTVSEVLSSAYSTDPFTGKEAFKHIIALTYLKVSGDDHDETLGVISDRSNVPIDEVVKVYQQHRQYNYRNGTAHAAGQSAIALPADTQDSVRASVQAYKDSGRNLCTPMGAADLIMRMVRVSFSKPEIDEFIIWASKHGIAPKGALNGYYKDAVRDVMNEKRQNKAASGDWRVQLRQTTDGKSYMSNSENIDIMLRNHEDLVGCFRYNEFSQLVMVVRKPPWAQQIGWTIRPLSDLMISSLMIYLQQQGLAYAKDTDIRKCVEVVAADDTYNDLTDYLSEQAENWMPGEITLDNWLIKLCGASTMTLDEHGNDLDITDYVRQAGRWWMISAVARAFNPGCKADYLLLLESPQGQRKSTTWMTLARRKEWYLEYSEDMNTDNGKRQLRGKWLIIMPELGALSRSEVNHVKGFITRQMENMRDIYEKYHRDHARTFVLAGDTNDDQYLADTTGNRRYWPIKISEVDINRLETVADALWGEAVLAYRSGEKWWPDNEDALFRRMQTIITDERLKRDPWQDEIARWLDTQGWPDKLRGASHVAQWALSLRKGDVNNQVSGRINAIMKRLKYKMQTNRDGAEVYAGYRRITQGE